MKFLLSFALILLSVTAIAETKFSVDVTIDKLLFQKPAKGVGKAGSLSFKSANLINNGIVLNVNNVNNYFDAQIFVRPTFLGFTTQFGNFGFALEDASVLNQVNQTELQNAKLVLDDYQLNMSGLYFSASNLESNVKLRNFLLYCQGNGLAPQYLNTGVSTPTTDIIKNCFSFMTLNGSYIPLNSAASIEYENVKNNVKTYLQSEVKSFDMRATLISADLGNTKVVTNDEFVLSANSVKMDCDKDADLTELDLDKIKKTCTNRLKIAPLKASIKDKKQNTTFDLDTNNIFVKDKILYAGLNSATLTGATSTTYLSNVLLNCKKGADSDLFEIMNVLRDCVTYGRLSIGSMTSQNKYFEDEKAKKPSSTKNLILNLDSGFMAINTAIHFLGLDWKVAIYGRIGLDESNKKIIVTVTDTKLPLGITSVKLLMYFLKKDLISKDIKIDKNVITISL